jgi:hypothetical protein
MSNAHTMGHERGAASLLVALVLMMSITLLTLAVAHTQLTETRMAGNERWQKRLLLAAESAAEAATAVLTRAAPALPWSAAGEDTTLVSRARPVESAGGVETRVIYRRSDRNSPFVEIQALSSAQGGRGIAARVSEQVRLLTVLSPLAESAPPLVINGCLSGGAVVSIRPINSDSDAAGAALWRYTPSPCPALAAIDMHAGRGGMKSLDDTLWTTFFSISRDEYARLAAAELALPSARRRYWQVDPAALVGGKWAHSLGNKDRPVVVYFPAATGCPRFAAGVRIFGVVFIDAACPEPLADRRLEVIGTLAINGNANSGHASIELQHIQNADRLQTRLSFPTIRVVRIPGGWKDF